MRIWQKIYFAVLLLFLLMLNAGLFLAAGFIFSYNMDQEQKKAETDSFFLCQSLLFIAAFSFSVSFPHS